MSISQFEAVLNQWGREQVSFLFLVDFEMENLLAWKLDEVPTEILFAIQREIAETVQPTTSPSGKAGMRTGIKPHPISFSEYKTKFDRVQNRIRLGDSYLANLTIKTKIECPASLEELFLASKARYKLCWKNKFLVFSPEPFVQIRDGMIYCFPMKGTINASVPHAADQILSDKKELSEHITIVDLIRNDLSAVATGVKVERFRYAEIVQTNQKSLVQISSQITGHLGENYLNSLGSILISLLPAGSVSGAPKEKTLQLIREAENEKRGFYTGIFGYFNGRHLDSAVMIRFIEQYGENFYYRSGGGITAQSEAEKEYQEAIDKIYVPVY